MNGDNGVNRANAAPNVAETVAVSINAEPQIIHRTKGLPEGLSVFELGTVAFTLWDDGAFEASSTISVSTLILESLGLLDA
jgi:hypothetical protein